MDLAMLKSIATLTKRASKNLSDAYIASLEPGGEGIVSEDLMAAWRAVDKALKTISNKAHDIRCTKEGTIPLSAARRMSASRR